MGCRPSKVADQAHEEQQAPAPASPAVGAPGLVVDPAASTQSLIDQVVPIQPLIDPSPSTQALIDQVPAIEPFVGADPEIDQAIIDPVDLPDPVDDKLVVKIRDSDHPFAMVIYHLAANAPVAIKSDASGQQKSVAVADEIGSDMALIRYLCGRWHNSFLHEGLANAIVHESVCNTLFLFLPSIEAISSRWSSSMSGSVQYFRWSLGSSVAAIKVYVEALGNQLQDSPFLCNDAMSLADLMAAACLMPLLQLRRILNLLPLSRLQNWLERVHVPARTCGCVLVLSESEHSRTLLDWASIHQPFALVLFVDTFSNLSEISLEKLPSLITVQDEGNINVVDDLPAIRAILQHTCPLQPTGNEKEIEKFRPEAGNRAELFVCPICNSLDCISAEHVALLLFAPNKDVRVNTSSSSSKSLIYFQNQTVHLSETPAVLRYLTRNRSELDHLTASEMAMIDENLTFLSQRIAPVVHDLIHGLE